MSRRLILAIVLFLATVGLLIFTFADNQRAADFFFGLCIGICVACLLMAVF